MSGREKWDSRAPARPGKAPGGRRAHSPDPLINRAGLFIASAGEKLNYDQKELFNTVLAQDATSCQWKLISGCCGRLPPWAPDLGRRLVGAGAPATLEALMTSACLQSHLVGSGLPEGSQCTGVRVLDANSGEGKVRGRGFMTQLKSSLPQSVPWLLQPTSTPFFSVPLQHLQSFIHILYSGWNSVCHLLAGWLEA